ncbi:MAG: sulfatase-like hydrolase/transferase, partial [Proteobacteria bacterium]|nr:sulfatase-like hydrolase/transferase [Pseudomonadota bacterium]
MERPRFDFGLAVAALLLGGLFAPTLARGEQKPNIVIIWGDDIGQADLSTYTFGLMGFQTPNIDRVAAVGVKFTDYYGEQSCTAGRAAFICGQNPARTGLTKVGLPGAE